MSCTNERVFADTDHAKDIERLIEEVAELRRVMEELKECFADDTDEEDSQEDDA